MAQNKAQQKQIAMMLKNRKKIGKKYFDYRLLFILILIMTFGLIMLYSTSVYTSSQDNGNMFQILIKQGGISILALFWAAVIMPRFSIAFYKKIAILVYLGSLALMLITPVVGTNINGATRWIFIGPLSFQPAEVGKVGVVLFMPILIMKAGRSILRLGGMFKVLILGLLPGLFAFIFTDNLSTGIIIMGIAVGMFFIAHPKYGIFIKLTFLGVIGAVGVVFYAISQEGGGNFRWGRIYTWLDPERHMSTGGYQIMQGLYAIGSGGFFGKGLGNSTQKLGVIPEAHNDMIFTIICEELGVFGAILVVLMFGYLIYRLWVIAANAPDLYSSLGVSGIMIHIALQVILNLAVATNTIPTTGVTLPFISMGGTSILFLMTEMGFALCVASKREIKY